ncbi:hypothetical protein [Streptomyces sp. NPDC002685]|uniref:hypothetical protein n=1 Tax=Streptomyces sp. NPDC002685 TaxID=3154540 RepID=UPI00333353E5
MIALATATTAMAGLFLAPAPMASAAATSCYGSAKTINGTDDNGHWPPSGSTYTTSNCNDINVKITRTIDVQTCFAPTSGGYYCNGWRTVYANTWGLAATDVRDGTNFWLLFTSTDVHGLAAY